MRSVRWSLIGAALLCAVNLGCKRKPQQPSPEQAVEEQPVTAVAQEPAPIPAAPPSDRSGEESLVRPRPQRPRMQVEVKKIDLSLGRGRVAEPGKTVSIHYVAKLPNGTEFDKSYGNPAPFSFVMGAGAVLRGWDQGIAGMREGGKRRLEIPPELAYGARGLPPLIPPDTPLVYEIELVEVK